MQQRYPQNNFPNDVHGQVVSEILHVKYRLVLRAFLEDLAEPTCFLYDAACQGH